MRTSQRRPSTALIAIGAFVLVLLVGVSILDFGDRPAPTPAAKTEAPLGRS